MTVRRAAAVAFAVLVTAAAALLAMPARFVVDGLSMAPGLMPGDVVSTGWIPAFDRLGPPRRFDRWIVEAPTGDLAVKRVAGLPGEEVAIRDGDLAVDGGVVLKSPAMLACVALPLQPPLEAGDRHARLAPADVLDDVTFAVEVNRPLDVVRDVGLVAVLRTGPTASAARVALDEAALTWRLPRDSCIRLIAGRLDGRVVAVAWRERDPTASADLRSGLPARVPAAWSYAAPCRVDPHRPAPLRCSLTVDGAAWIERAAGWRDVQLRPVGDGTTSWRLDGDSYFVLGDFPTGSIDSRQWGPRPRHALTHRLAPGP